MNFKKIEVYGFKSFADKLVVKFEQGITAIVGPNGCGKSNVADSIRWVLGEQSAKLLRGSSMQDVIFKGSQQRKSLSYCEVSLYFDNTNKMFDLEYSEVSITRKLYRSGESVYQINKQNARLKDVADLLHQAGMGRDSYAIIGQGKVEEILSSKPADRRAIFEEATQIAKAKRDKIESERKLLRARDNLVRLKDITNELERQLGPLKRQSEDAKKYNEFRDQLKYHEINNFIYEYENINSKKEEINVTLQGVNDEYAMHQAELDKYRREYAECIERSEKLDSELASLNDRRVQLTLLSQNALGQINVSNNTIALKKKENESLERRVADFTSKYEYATKMLKEKNSSLDILDKQINEFCQERDAVLDKLQTANAEIQERENSNREAQSLMIDSINELSEVKARISGLESEKTMIIERRKILELKVVECEAELADVKKSRANLELALNNAEKEKQEIEKKTQDIKNAFEEKARELKQLTQEYNELHSLHASQVSEEKIKTSFKNNLEGLNLPVKNLFRGAENNPEIKNKIEGMVAKLLNVPEKFEVAIETVLGGAMQHIVTRTQEDAKSLISYLKQNGFGTLTFYPMSHTKPRFMSKEELSLANHKGCYGVAADVVKFDKQYANVFASLLGKTVIVENMDVAVEIAKRGNLTFKIVALDGDYISPGGSMTGGSRRSNAVASGLLSYDRELKILQQQIQDSADELARKKQQIAKLEKDVQGAEVDFSTAQKQIHEKDINCINARESYNKFLTKEEELESRVHEYKTELCLIENRIEHISDTFVETGELSSTLAERKNNASNEIELKQGEYQKLKDTYNVLNNQLMIVRTKISDAEADVRNIRLDIARLTDDVNEISEQISESTKEISQNKEIIRDSENTIMVNSSFEMDTIMLKEVDEKISNMGSVKKEISEKLVTIESLRETEVEKVQELTNMQTTIRFKLDSIDTNMETMQAQILEDYSLTYDQCYNQKDVNYEMRGSITAIKNFKRQISALGSINTNAIEEYKVVGARYEELTTQITDIEKAEQDILEIIKVLAIEMTEKFNTGFAKINEYFMQTFKELFGGGNARLILVPSETGDPLDDGVEIEAEPPGKKLQTISLLSGGERALTAIAILFAILKLNPMPFCVLDEIEAALDDANVGRFAKYLRKFSLNTQFIVITHRKPTMELADVLYGVTMEEKGVSKMVSVSFEDVKHLTETA